MKLKGWAPLGRWTHLVTHGVKHTCDLMQTQCPVLNCYGFACSVVEELRKEKVQQAQRAGGTEEDYYKYLQEPLWHLMGYSCPEDMKVKEATALHRPASCCSESSAFSERHHLPLRPSKLGETWAENPLVQNFLLTDPAELQQSALNSWYMFSTEKKKRKTGFMFMADLLDELRTPKGKAT